MARETYKVKKGDSYFKIAERLWGNQLFAGQLIKANPGINKLFPGIVLRLPKVDVNDPEPWFGQAAWGRARDMDDKQKRTAQQRRDARLPGKLGSDLLGYEEEGIPKGRWQGSPDKPEPEARREDIPDWVFEDFSDTDFGEFALEEVWDDVNEIVTLAEKLGLVPGPEFGQGEGGEETDNLQATATPEVPSVRPTPGPSVTPEETRTPATQDASQIQSTPEPPVETEEISVTSIPRETQPSTTTPETPQPQRSPVPPVTPEGTIRPEPRQDSSPEREPEKTSTPVDQKDETHQFTGFDEMMNKAYDKFYEIIDEDNTALEKFVRLFEESELDQIFGTDLGSQRLRWAMGFTQSALRIRGMDRFTSNWNSLMAMKGSGKNFRTRTFTGMCGVSIMRK